MRVWPHAGDACKALNGFRVGRGFWALRPLARRAVGDASRRALLELEGWKCGTQVLYLVLTPRTTALAVFVRIPHSYRARLRHVPSFQPRSTVCCNLQQTRGTLFGR